jgi:hypothetical protein
MVEDVSEMSDWLHISHPDAGATRVPDQPGVRESYEARGWVVGPDPEADAGPFVPPKVVEANEEDGWVTLYHPVTHAAHRFPSHPDAVQGAYETGWQATPPKTEPDPVPVEKSTAKKASKHNESATPATDEGE